MAGSERRAGGLVTVALAVCAVVAALAFPTLHPTGGGGATSPTTARTVRHPATIVGAIHDVRSPPGQRRTGPLLLVPVGAALLLVLLASVSSSATVRRTAPGSSGAATAPALLPSRPDLSRPHRGCTRAELRLRRTGQTEGTMSITTDGVDVPPDLGGVTLVHWPRDEALEPNLAGRAGRGSSCSTRPGATPRLGRARRLGAAARGRRRGCAPGRHAAPASRAAVAAWPMLDTEGILRDGGPGWRSRRSRPASWRPCCTPRVRSCRASTSLEAGWPGGALNSRLLDRRIMLLRGRIEPLGLVIRTVRGKGFLLERPSG